MCIYMLSNTMLFHHRYKVRTRLCSSLWSPWVSTCTAVRCSTPLKLCMLAGEWRTLYNLHCRWFSLLNVNAFFLGMKMPFSFTSSISRGVICKYNENQLVTKVLHEIYEILTSSITLTFTASLLLWYVLYYVVLDIFTIHFDSYKSELFWIIFKPSTLGFN